MPFFCLGAASQVRDADSFRAPGLTSGLQGSVNVHHGALLIVGATVTVHQFFCILHFCQTCSPCRVELVVQFPASEGFDSSVIMFFSWCVVAVTLPQMLHYDAFFLVCCGCDTSYIVSVNIQCQASIYTLFCVAGIHGGCG